VQILLDASPTSSVQRVGWDASIPLSKAIELAIGIIQITPTASPGALDDLSKATEQILRTGSKRAKVVVADGLLRSLFNLTSHPESGVSRDELVARFGTLAREVFLQLDDEWRRIDAALETLPNRMRPRLALAPEAVLWSEMADNLRISDQRFIGSNDRARYGPSYFWEVMKDS
jgi:hypothetical protein